MEILRDIADQVYDYFFYPPLNYYIIVLRLLIFLCTAAFSYLLAEKLMVFISVRVKKGSQRFRLQTGTGKNIRKPYKEYEWKFLRFIDVVLEKNGRPLGLNAFRYLMVKSSLGFMAVIPTLLLGLDIELVLVFWLSGFFSLDILIVADAVDNSKRIEKDMPNIINNLYMQMEANIPFKQCLETLHMSSVHSTLLKNCLKELQLRFLIKDHDIVAVCDDLENRLDNISFSVLLMAFRQYKDSGKMKDILRRQNELHMKKEEEVIERESRAVIKLAAASTALIAINCILMLVYPMFLTMSEKMHILLK